MEAILVYLVQLMAMLIVMFGIGSLVSRKWLEAVIAYFTQDRRIMTAAVARVGIGLLFLVAYRFCRFPQVILVVGLVAFLTGIAFLGMGPQRTRQILLKWTNLKPLLHVIWSISAIASGVFIYLSA
jgi:hypothetical protein